MSDKSGTGLVACAACVLLAMASAARAQTSPVADAGPFAQGNWTLQIYGGYIQNFGGRTASIGAGTAGVGYFVADNVSLSFELSGYAIALRDQSALGINPALLLRYHFLNTGRLSLYGEVRGGVFEGDHDVPPDGTHLNFTFEPGGGLAYRLGDNTWLMAGGRYFHLSNANTQADHHNPSINAAEGYVGIMFKL